jgi:hypothetical protein
MREEAAGMRSESLSRVLGGTWQPSDRRVSRFRPGTRPGQRTAGSVGAEDKRESVMGVGKKAKHKAKVVKGKAKKGAGKLKHKGKKAKNASRH